MIDCECRIGGGVVKEGVDGGKGGSGGRWEKERSREAFCNERGPGYPFKSMWTHVSGWPEPQQRPVRFVYLFAFFSAGYGEEAAAISLGGDLALSFARSFSHPAAFLLSCNSCS